MSTVHPALFAAEARVAGWEVREKRTVSTYTVAAERVERTGLTLPTEGIAARWRVNDKGHLRFERAARRVSVPMADGSVELRDEPLTLKAARAGLHEPLPHVRDGEVYRLPWSPGAPLSEIMAAVAGHTIVWRNGTSGKLEEAAVPGSGLHMRLTLDEILNFASADGGGFRSVRLSAIRKVV